MPITSSAKKALRASKRKKVFNARRKNAIEQVVKKIKKLLRDKKVAEARKMVSSAYKAIDKAMKGKTIKKNAAGRKKSRLMSLINRAK